MEFNGTQRYCFGSLEAYWQQTNERTLIPRAQFLEALFDTFTPSGFEKNHFLTLIRFWPNQLVI